MMLMAHRGFRRNIPGLTVEAVAHGTFDMASEKSARGTLNDGSVQTMPFVRPHFGGLLSAPDFAIERNCPARGQYAEAV